MPETAPALARPAFHGLLHPSRHGAAASPSGTPGLVVQERAGLAGISVAAFRDKAAAVRDAVQRATGVTLPITPRRIEAGGIVALWAGPGQWLLLAAGPAGDALESRLGPALAGLAAVAAVGDGRAVLAVSGPQARRILAKGLAIDLDPAVFAEGATALTMVSMIDVQLSRLPGADAFELVLFRSLASSLWHWLEESGAEYGIEVLPPA